MRDYRSNDFSDEEVIAAREDVRNGLKTAFCMYHALDWIYGKTAFGLRMAAWLAATTDYQWLMRLSILFARLRRTSQKFLSSNEIAEMAAKAEQTWLMSVALRQQIKSNTEFGKIYTRKRLKLAFSDSQEIRIMIKYTNSYGFFLPRISPWDEWNKLSTTKKMPFGLLAMSIGSPNSLDLANIVRSVNENATL